MGKSIYNNLGKDETVLYEAKIAWWSIIPHILSIFLVIGIFTIIPQIIKILTTDLGFTNKKISGKTGLIKTKRMDSPLSKINNVSISSGLGGKICNYGNVTVMTSSGSYKFRPVSKPNEFRAQLINQVEQYEEDRIKKQAEEMAKAIKNT